MQFNTIIYKGKDSFLTTYLLLQNKGYVIYANIIIKKISLKDFYFFVNFAK